MRRFLDMQCSCSQEKKSLSNFAIKLSIFYLRPDFGQPWNIWSWVLNKTFRCMFQHEQLSSQLRTIHFFAVNWKPSVFCTCTHVIIAIINFLSFLNDIFFIFFFVDRQNFIIFLHTFFELFPLNNYSISFFMVIFLIDSVN